MSKTKKVSHYMDSIQKIVKENEDNRVRFENGNSSKEFYEKEIRFLENQALHVLKRIHSDNK